MAEAVAAERQGVGAEAEAVVAHIERALALEWRVRVTVGLHKIPHNPDRSRGSGRKQFDAKVQLPLHILQHCCPIIESAIAFTVSDDNH